MTDRLRKYARTAVLLGTTALAVETPLAQLMAQEGAGGQVANGWSQTGGPDWLFSGPAVPAPHPTVGPTSTTQAPVRNVPQPTATTAKQADAPRYLAGKSVFLRASDPPARRSTIPSPTEAVQLPSQQALPEIRVPTTDVAATRPHAAPVNPSVGANFGPAAPPEVARPKVQPLPTGPELGMPVAAKPMRQVDPVTRLANSHLAQGKELAARGAAFSARDEFVQALRAVAQGLDVQQQTVEHSRALTAALRALDEVDDFMTPKDSLEADVNVRQVAEAHNTPVLSGLTNDIPSVVAQQKYYEFAREQFAAAVPEREDGAEALYDLGRLYAAMEASPAATVRIHSATTKALVFYQAAVAAYPGHANAANELGVLLARFGREEEALGWLRHSAQLRPTPESWHNVAIVSRRLGQLDVSGQAQQMVARLSGGRPESVGGPLAPEVTWVAPEQFAGTQEPALDATTRKPVPAALPSPMHPTADARSAPQPEEKKKKWIFW